MPKIKVYVVPPAVRKPETERNNQVNATENGWIRTPLNHDDPEVLSENRGLVDLLEACNLQADGVTKIDANKPIGREVIIEVYNPDAVAVQSIEILPPNGTITVDDTVAFDYDVTPANATYPDVEWSSSDETILQSLGGGQFKALKAGSVTITAVSIDGDKTDTYEVTVVAAEVPPEEPVTP